MALIIYRRHRADCKVHGLKLPGRAKRFYADCDCKIWITGTTPTERYPRQATGMTDWRAAQAYVTSLSAGAKDTAVHGPTLADCIRRHLEAHAENIAPATLGHHRLLLGKLEVYAKSRNKTFMSDLTVDLLEDFKTESLANLRSTTRSTSVAKLKYFLREAYRRGWTTEALAEKVRSTRAVYEQKQPYSDAEVAAILVHAESLNGSRTGYAANGPMFRLLLELMLETGMRVSDAIRYDPRNCAKSSHLWIYTFTPTKQRKNTHLKQTTVYLPEWLKLAIDNTPWFSPALPFAYRDVDSGTTLEAIVYERMQAIGERCGVPDCRPHRLRDTCAVRLLLRGVSLENVSRLLGHSSIGITEKFYSPWIPARQHQLEGVLAEALMDSRGN
jgi:integrase/recombinase XerD